jgi:hypothetical protein
MSASLLGSLGTELAWQVLGSMLAVVVSVAVCLPALRGAPVSPLRLVAGAALAGALPLALTRVLLIGWDEVGTERLRVTTFAAQFLLAPLTAGPAIVTTSLFAVYAGARDPARAWWRAGVVVGATLAAAAALVGVGHSTGNWVYADLRAGVYVAVGAWLGVGALGAGPRERGGPDAGAAAAALLPLVVGLGEASERGLVWLVASNLTSSVAPELWGEFVTRIRGTVALEWAVSWGVLGLAALASAAVALRPEAPARTLGPWSLGVALGAATLLASDLAPARLQVLERTCTGVVPPSTDEQRPQGQEQPERDDLPPDAEPERGEP